jgi:hypothetical protein
VLIDPETGTVVSNRTAPAAATSGAEAQP